MSTLSTPSVTNSRSTARARWALLAALVVGAAGGAGLSAGLVQSQVRTVHHVRTVYVPVSSVSEPPASPGAELCHPGYRYC
jgi:hypothetical protein